MKIVILVLPLLAISFLSAVARGFPHLAVYDTDGNPVSLDSQYHVLPVDNSTAGGGLRALRGEVATCSFFLAQGHGENTTDLVEIKPRDNSVGTEYIHLSSDVMISFSNLATTFCMQSTSWFLANRAPVMSSLSASAPPLQYVAVGDPVYHVDPHSSDVFRIEKYGRGDANTYKLVSVADDGRNEDLGLYASSKDQSWVAVNESPLVVVFKKGNAKVHA